jgi:hypothetical protein
MDDLQPNPDSKLLPAIRVAPLGELRVYIISEEELNELEHGSPASQNLNFALALLASGLTFLTTLLTTEIDSVKTFVVFVVLTVAFLLVGALLLANWLRIRRSSGGLAQRIRDRMPPPQGIPEH